jgi:hypothetical protein
VSPEATIRLGHLLEREAAGVALTAEERAEAAQLKAQAKLELPTGEPELAREKREEAERREIIEEVTQAAGRTLLQVLLGFLRGLFRR